MPRAALGLTWTCSSVKMVCSCICGTGLLVMTDISRICLKTCHRREMVAGDLRPTQVKRQTFAS